MKTTFLPAAVWAAFLAPSALVAQNKGLLYTSLNGDISNQCAAAAFPQLTNVAANEVQHVVPAAAPTSAAFAPGQGYQVMVGDSNCNGSYHDNLFGRIDAVLPPVAQGGGAILPNARNVWFSVAAVTPALAGPSPFDPGDIGRFLTFGTLEKFITAAQINAAFNINGADVDAAAMCGGSIFLSFEAQVVIGGVVVPDGSIIAIPANAIVWGVSPYDGALVVNNVMANMGVIIALEATVNTWVANSGIKNNAAAAAGPIVDLNGLEYDPLGGTFYSQYVENHPSFPAGQVCNLIFCGESLTGGGIVSSGWNGASYGRVAVINGVPMGNDGAGGATTGARVGLVTGGGVGTLNGLGLTTSGLVRCATQCTQVLPVAGGMLTIELGSPAGGFGTVWIKPGVVAPCLVDPSFAFANCAFPDLYPPVHVLPGGASGCQSWNIPVPPLWFPTRIVIQGIEVPAAGPFCLSTPSAVSID